MNHQVTVQKSEIKKINIVAILSIFLFSGAGTYMNAAVQTMIEAWPQLSPTMVRMVTSLPALISLPVTILVGSLAGRKLSYRFCAIFGTGLILVAMRNSLILKSVPNEQQAAVIGYGSSLMNAGGMLAGPIVGAMAVLGWRVPFLFDLFAIVPIILMVFWLKEPAGETTGTEVQEGSVKAKATSEERPDFAKAGTGTSGMDWRVVFYILAQFLMNIALYPLLSGMSTYLTAKHLGTSVTAGWSNAFYCLAGVIISIILDPVERKLGKHLFPFMCILFAAGMGLIVFVPVLPAVFHRGSDIESTYLGSMLVYLAFAVIAILFKVAPKEYYQNNRN